MVHHHKDRSARVLARVLNVEPGEAPAVAAGLVMFFLLFTGYFMLRPVRETMGVASGPETCSGFLPAPSWRPWRSFRSLGESLHHAVDQSEHLSLPRSVGEILCDQPSLLEVEEGVDAG